MFLEKIDNYEKDRFYNITILIGTYDTSAEFCHRTTKDYGCTICYRRC